MKNYEDWKEFLKEYDLSYLKSKEDGVKEISISDFLNQPEIAYHIGGKYFDINMKSSKYNEKYLIRNSDDITSFWVFFIMGVCQDSVFFSKEEAEKAYNKILIRELKFYDNWQDFLKTCDFSGWMSRAEGPEETSIGDYLCRTDTDYERVFIMNKTYLHILPGNHEECFVRETGCSIWLLYIDRRRRGGIYSSKEEAEADYKNIKKGKFYRKISQDEERIISLKFVDGEFIIIPIKKYKTNEEWEEKNDLSLIPSEINRWEIAEIDKEKQVVVIHSSLDIARNLVISILEKNGYEKIKEE